MELSDFFNKANMLFKEKGLENGELHRASLFTTRQWDIFSKDKDMSNIDFEEESDKILNSYSLKTKLKTSTVFEVRDYRDGEQMVILEDTFDGVCSFIVLGYLSSEPGDKVPVKLGHGEEVVEIDGKSVNEPFWKMMKKKTKKSFREGYSRYIDSLM